MPDTDEKPEIPQEFRNAIKAEIDGRIGSIQTKARYFLYGLGGFLTLLLIVGLLDQGDILRSLHDAAFPPVSASDVAISYEGFIELQWDDPRKQSHSVHFYAKPGQPVSIYLKANHRFAGNFEERKVLVTLDGNDIGAPATQFSGGFMNVTDVLQFKPDLQLGQDVHWINFALDDTQAEDLSDEVTIVCIVLVYGRGGSGA